LRGRIDIYNIPGKGCSFYLRVPLTLAITDGIVVRVGTQRYILPAVGVRTTIQPKKTELTQTQSHGEYVMFMGKLVPILRLYRLLEVPKAVEDPTHALLVIVDEGSALRALLVDEILGKQQVVAKSLGDGIKRVRGVFGGAILGDGRVGLILDPPGLAALADEVLGGEHFN
jgi:two-component system chemotaxis sensor kinase CheA